MSSDPVPAFPVSDHCDGHRFFNPGVDTDRGFADLWRWRREGKRVPWPAFVPSVSAPPPPAAAGSGEVLLTLVGHSTVLIPSEVSSDPFAP